MTQLRPEGPDRPVLRTPLSRRTIMRAGAIGTALAALEMVKPLARIPDRAALAAPAPPSAGGTSGSLPDIQFDIGRFIAPAQTINNVAFQFPPVHTTFVTAQLVAVPDVNDQQNLSDALNTIEQVYPFSAGGIITFVSYGVPYFNLLPGSLVSRAIPRLRSDGTTLALQRAVAGPTDFPTAAKANPDFQVAVKLESNHLLFTFRGDNASFLQDVINWFFNGSNSLGGFAIASPNLPLTVTSSRAQFLQMGLPAKVAADNNLPFARFVNAQSPMWMSFADQQVDGSGPAAICTFAGNASSRLTTARAGDYFDNGGIQHLSHVLMDLQQFYGVDANGNTLPPNNGQEPFSERVQYMFRSNPIPEQPDPNDQFKTDTAFLDNRFVPPDANGITDAQHNAQADGTLNGEHRMGHLTALQRSTRAADRTPVHIRMDGPGFDSLDVPSRKRTAKLQFTIFVPTSKFFADMRVNQASLDLVNKFGVAAEDNGLERFLTATRRQNFLVPPRRNRAFPLVEFT